MNKLIKFLLVVVIGSLMMLVFVFKIEFYI